MRLLRKFPRICACGKGHQNVWFNSGTILSIKSQREMSSDSTVDMKSNRVGKSNFNERNVKKRTVNQPQVRGN